MTKGLGICGALWALLGTTACSSLGNCPASEEPRLIDDGVTNLEKGSYESKPWDGKLDHFPAKSALWFEHGLGVTPLDVTTYLSFKDVGTNDADGGSVTTSAGNQNLYDCVDDRFIVVRNDTCEPSFYIRVTATGVGSTPKKSCGDPPVP